MSNVLAVHVLQAGLLRWLYHIHNNAILSGVVAKHFHTCPSADALIIQHNNTINTGYSI